jgi:hypothetical protein
VGQHSHHPFGVPRQRVAGGGELNPAADAFRKFDAGLIFQLCDLLRNRRGRQEQSLSGGRYRAAPRQLQQHPQSPDFQSVYLEPDRLNKISNVLGKKQ